MQLPLSASALVLLGVGAVVAGLLILVVLAVRRRRQVSDAARVPRPPHGAWGPPAGAPRSASPAAPAAVDPARRPASSATRTGEAGAAAPVSAEPSRGWPEGGAGSVPQPRSGSADHVAAAATARAPEVTARVSPERVRAAHVPAEPLRHQAGSARTVAAAVAQAFAVRAAASRAAASGPGIQPPPSPTGEAGAVADGGVVSSRESTKAWPVPPYAAPAPDAEAAAGGSRGSAGPAAPAGFEAVPAQPRSDVAAPAVSAEFGSGGAVPAASAGLGSGGAVSASGGEVPAVSAELGSGGAAPPASAGFASGAAGQAGGPLPGGQAAGQVPGPDGARHVPAPAGDSDGDGRTAMAEQVTKPPLGPEDSEQPYTEAPRSNGGQPIPAPEVGSGGAEQAAGTESGSGAGQAAMAGVGSNGDGPAAAADQASDGSGVPGGEARAPAPAGPARWVAGWSTTSKPVPERAAADPAVATVPVSRPEHHKAAHADTAAGDGKARRLGGSVSAARDRLLAVLLDDPERAVGAVVELEDCLRELDRLSDTMRTERAVLHDALRHLAAAGLRPDQLARLAGMPLMEVEEQLGAERAEQQA